MTKRIDARGMRCPWPAIRLAKAWREAGGPVEILADDPVAVAEINLLAVRFGAEITPFQDDQGPGYRLSSHSASTANLPPAPMNSDGALGQKGS